MNTALNTMRYFLIGVLGLLQVNAFAQQGALSQTLDQGIAFQSVNKVTLPPSQLSEVAAGFLIQEKTISGSVTDQENGEALPGVNVVVKGTTVGTVTDIDGNYQIAAPNDAEVLVFSSVGYEGKEVSIGNQSVVNVQMAPDVQSLSEVVVVGYGSVKKEDLTGSVSSIDGEDIKLQPVASIDQGMSGLAAGLQVTQGSASPGGGTSIRIRGGNSILGGNEPLYVIDGFPVYSDINQNQPAGTGTGGAAPANPLASINPNDIESIEVLKDASATAIYGARGANGVIIVTTKRGEPGRVRVNYDGYYGLQEVARKIELMNGEQMAEFHNRYAINEGREPVFDGVTLPTPEEIGEGTDWQDVILQTAPVQDHNVSVSGGDENTLYALSLNYFDQEGIVKNTGFQRGSIRINLDQEIGSRLKVGTSLFYSRSERIGNQSETSFGGGRGAVHAMLSFNPALPVYREDGTYSENADIPFGASTIDNPLRVVNLYEDNTLIDRFLGNLYAEVEVAEGLTFRSSLGVNNNAARRNAYFPRETLVGRDVRGRASQSRSNVVSFVTDNIFSYQRTLGQIHHINAVAGFTYQEEVSSRNQIEVLGFVTDDFSADYLQAGDTPLPPNSSKAKWQLASWVGRVNYTLLDRYLFTFTGRADGSSKFGVNNKWAFFPSAAVAWRLSDEPFMQELNFFDDLKLRGSYGITGNSEIGLYNSIPQLTTLDYTFNDALAIGFVPDNIPNEDLKWETTSMLDVGLDLGVLNNRLRFTFDYYYKETTDLLLNRSVPNSTGFSSALENRGSIENEGIELSLGADILDGDFKWTLSGNFSANRNKILDLGDSREFFSPGITSAGIIKTNEGTLVRVGEPVGVYYVLVNDGVFQNEAQLDEGPVFEGFHEVGYPRFLDKNDDGTIDDEDRFVYGNPNPDFIYGFTNKFSYKGFDLSILITGTEGNSVLNLLRARGARVRPNEAQLIEIADYWTPENTDTNIPKAEDTGFQRFSSRNFEDGSHWRIRNLTLGYNLPTNRFLSNGRVYFGVQNLYIHTDYTGYDPDVNSGGDNAGAQDNFNRGVDRAAYPSARTYTLGINLGL